jgi:hypothetical protein
VGKKRYPRRAAFTRLFGELFGKEQLKVFSEFYLERHDGAAEPKFFEISKLRLGPIQAKYGSFVGMFVARFLCIYKFKERTRHDRRNLW